MNPPTGTVYNRPFGPFDRPSSVTSEEEIPKIQPHSYPARYCSLRQESGLVKFYPGTLRVGTGHPNVARICKDGALHPIVDVLSHLEVHFKPEVTPHSQSRRTRTARPQAQSLPTPHAVGAAYIKLLLQRHGDPID